MNYSYINILLGRRISGVSVDLFAPPVRLYSRYEEGPDLELEINCPFSIEHPAGLRSFDPEAEIQGVTGLERLVGEVVAEASVDEGDALHLAFQGGAHLTVPPHLDHESWYLNSYGEAGHPNDR
jgi:hypothetical protein